MTYPPVIQFETRAIEAQARAQLTRERRAARSSEQAIQSRRRFWRRAQATTLTPGNCNPAGVS